VPLPYLQLDDTVLTLGDGTPLLSVTSLAVADGALGIVGPNGSGKSRLLRVMAGTEVPAAGSRRVQGRIVHVVQDRALSGRGTIADALGVSRHLAARQRLDAGAGTADDLDLMAPAWDVPERARAALADVALSPHDLERPFATLSGGERARCWVAAAILAEPDVLLLDEPTNDLDVDARAAIHALVRNWRRGLVVASHDRELLRHVDRIAAIEQGELQHYGGAWDDYWAAVTAAREAAERELASADAESDRARRQAQVVRERQARRDAAGRRSRTTGSHPKLVLNAKRERSQGTGARLADATARGVAEAAERRTEAAARLEQRTPFAFALPPTSLPRGTTVLAFEQVSAGHDAATPLLVGVDLVITGPERVAIAGPNGAGKSTLLQVISGRRTALAGRVHRGVPVHRIGYIDQATTWIDAHATVREAFEARHPRADVTVVRAALARFGFRAADASRAVATLSGGERMRASFAAEMAGEHPPQLLVLDEPANHLDLTHLEGLESALAAYDGALVVVSHDASFLEQIGITRRVDVTRWRPSHAT